MFGSNILEIAIGVVFIYLLLSLICTAINEGMASIINKRGKNLFAGITNLLNDPKFTGLAQQLYTHGLVDGISQNAANPDKPNRLPSYLPSNTFALALLDILGSLGAARNWQDTVAQRTAELTAVTAQLNANPTDPGLQKLFKDVQAAVQRAQQSLQQAQDAQRAHDDAQKAAQQVTGPRDVKGLNVASKKFETALALGRALAAQLPDPLTTVQMAVEDLPDGHTKESIRVLIAKARRDTALLSSQVAAAELQIEKLQENLEHWFNDAMDRVGGWYKRWTQLILLVISVILVLAANADTLMLVKRFARDDVLRASIVTAAEHGTRTDAAGRAQAPDELLAQAGKLTLPLGWTIDESDPYKTDQLPETPGGWLLKLVGLVISVCAVQLGAPFWFDTLSKFVNVRGAGTPPGEGKKSAPQPAKN